MSGKTKLLKFKSDVEIRKKYFSPGEKGHPARANLYMMIWLIKKLTKPGDLILDPTSGVGSLMYATKLGRNVINIELEQHFYDTQNINWAYFATHQQPTGTFGLLHGDARRFLPYPANHCIFSPPYSVNISGGGAKVAAMAAESGTSVAGYGKDRAQLCTLSYFNLLMGMKEIYRGIYNSLPIGGFLATITKDSVNSKEAKFRGFGGIEPYSADTIKICHEVGFTMYELWQRDAKPSMRLQIAWSQNPGIPHVVTEEIIIMRKEK